MLLPAAPLGAVRAGERLLARVRPYVVAQVGGDRRGERAEGALVLVWGGGGHGG